MTTSLPVLLLRIGLLAILVAGCDSSNGPRDGLVPAAATVTIGSDSLSTDRIVNVPIRLASSLESPTSIDSIQRFQLAIEYDFRHLQFIDARLGEAPTEWAKFNFISGYSDESLMRGIVRMSGIRGHSNQSMPVGELAILSFYAIPESTMNQRATQIHFASGECEDNTLTDGSSDSLLHFPKRLRTGDSISEEVDTLSCPRYFSLSQDLELVAGTILLEPDSTAGPRGDLSLDGQVDIVDVASFIDRYLRSDTAFSDNPILRDRQLRELDVNRDGIALQVSDLELLIMIALRGFALTDPVFPITDLALCGIEANREGFNFILRAEAPVTMVYLDFEHVENQVLGFDYISVGTDTYDIIYRRDHTIFVFDATRFGTIASSNHPLEIHFVTAPHETVCLRAVQVSSRPGIAISVEVHGDSCTTAP